VTQRKFERGDLVECVATFALDALELGSLYSVKDITPEGIVLYGWDTVWNNTRFKLYNPLETQQTAIKFDSDKPPMHLLSGPAMQELAKSLGHGSKKYSDYNYRNGFKWSRMTSSLLRHVFAWMGGEDRDPESGLSHIAHAMACCMMLLDHELLELGEDDRWTK
jgi:hypothetical protein